MLSYSKTIKILRRHNTLPFSLIMSTLTASVRRPKRGGGKAGSAPSKSATGCGVKTLIGNLEARRTYNNSRRRMSTARRQRWCEDCRLKARSTLTWEAGAAGTIHLHVLMFLSCAFQRPPPSACFHHQNKIPQQKSSCDDLMQNPTSALGRAVIRNLFGEGGSHIPFLLLPFSLHSLLSSPFSLLFLHRESAPLNPVRNVKQRKLPNLRGCFCVYRLYVSVRCTLCVFNK